MLFTYDRKGLPGAPEVYIFQDLLDHPRAMREIGKPLEPHFQVIYFYFPDPVHWLKPNLTEDFAEQSKHEILPLLEENIEKKVVIMGGFSFGFWMQILAGSWMKIKSCYFLNPELDQLGSIETFFEVSRIYWEKRGFYFLDWLQAQPIAHHLALFQKKPRDPFPFPIAMIRSQDSQNKYKYYTQKIIKRYPTASFHSFPQENWESLKKSRPVKKLLLKNISEDFKIKTEKIWSDLVKI